mgnify:CR=1 FL=1
MVVTVCSCNHLKDPLERNQDQIFLKGEKLVSDNFSGTAWFSPLIRADTVNTNGVGVVTFEPGARTNWHMHPAGQIILVTDGTGYYQEKGTSKRILRKGDAVKCPANVIHWHGASPNDSFIQVAITGRQNGPTVWGIPVTDKEYLSGQSD